MPAPYERKSDVLLETLIEKIDNLNNKLDLHIKEEEEKIGELLDAFATSKHIVLFVKWTVSIVASIALGWAWVTDHFTIGVK